MRDLKKLFLLVLGLTLLGGLGAGVWVGTLVAAPAGGAAAPHDIGAERIEDWRNILHLDDAQVRTLRDILARHDHDVARVRNELTREQFQEIQDIHDRARQRIRAVLTPEQNRIWGEHTAEHR